MKIDNPFDKKLEVNRRSLSSSQIDALTEVTDTLDFAWVAARSVFEESATPEHALKICELMLIGIHRNQDTLRIPSNMADE
jgi:hypothetical protein